MKDHPVYGLKALGLSLYQAHHNCQFAKLFGPFWQRPQFQELDINLFYLIFFGNEYNSNRVDLFGNKSINIVYKATIANRFLGRYLVFKFLRVQKMELNFLFVISIPIFDI